AEALELELQPGSEREHIALADAVAASLAIDRARRAEAHALADLNQDADRDRQHAEALDADRLGRDLAHRPGQAARHPERTAAGRRGMIAGLELPRDALAIDQIYSESKKDLILNLMGHEPADVFDEPFARQLALHCLAASSVEPPDAKFVREYLGPSMPSG